MSSLTKEQLKNELINHGVPLPAASARKEEYIKLYEQHVAPIANQKGEFSSDEDIDESRPKVQITVESSLLIDGLDITALSDDELFQRLKELGASIGPVVDSTRGFYQRKLANLLSAKESGPSQTNGQFNGDDVKEDEFSDSSDVQEIILEEESFDASEEAPSAEKDLPAEEPLTTIRKRILASEHHVTSLSAQPLVDRQGTPTPRPSIRSGTSSNTGYAFESRRLASSVPSRAEVVQSKPRSYRLVYLILLVLLAIGVFFAYQNLDRSVVTEQLERAKAAIKNLVSEAKHVAEEVDHAEANPIPEA